MDEFSTDEATESPEGAPTSPRWTGAPSIVLARQLNEQCIALLCEVAATLSYQELPSFVLQNRDLWRLLEPEARNRVATFPFVIVDLRFKDAESWQRAGDGHLVSPAGSTEWGGLQPKPLEDLVLETLLFARQSAREDINVAKAMFAMTSSVASRIASLTLQQVRTIAAGNSRQFRVRWDSDPEFWRDLLMASRAADEQALVALRRHAKLLFCGELVPTRP
jgi:hypothetical protein